MKCALQLKTSGGFLFNRGRKLIRDYILIVIIDSYLVRGREWVHNTLKNIPHKKNQRKQTWHKQAIHESQLFLCSKKISLFYTLLKKPLNSLRGKNVWIFVNKGILCRLSVCLMALMKDFIVWGNSTTNGLLPNKLRKTFI